MVNDFEDRKLFLEGDDQNDSQDDSQDDADNADNSDSQDDSQDDADNADDSDDDSKDNADDQQQDDKKKVEKPVETPEAKRARLKRQLAQHEKKHGFAHEEPKKKRSVSLSPSDTMALVNAKVHEDDINEIIEYAKFKGITVKEALNSSVIKSSLAEKTEQRATADATNTGRARSAPAKVTGDTLLEKAKKTGEIPDSDEGVDALVDARIEGKSKKK